MKKTIPSNEKGYGTYTLDTMAVAAYTERQNRKFGHPIHAALLGKCGYEYLTVLLGVPCAGGITYPADIQLNNETLVENFEKADIDILFYDRDFISQVQYLKENCPCIKKYICLQSVKKCPHSSTDPQILPCRKHRNPSETNRLCHDHLHLRYHRIRKRCYAVPRQHH